MKKSNSLYFRVNLSLSVKCSREKHIGAEDWLVVSVTMEKGPNGSLTLHDVQAKVTYAGTEQVVTFPGIERSSYEDGSALVDKAFGGDNPRIAINSLSNENEWSEQKGSANLLRGICGMFRNATAHAPGFIGPWLKRTPWICCRSYLKFIVVWTRYVPDVGLCTRCGSTMMER